MKAINEKLQTVYISDIYDATEFHYQDPTSAELEKIESVLKDFDSETAQPLHLPIKIGTPCFA